MCATLMRTRLDTQKFEGVRLAGDTGQGQPKYCALISGHLHHGASSAAVRSGGRRSGMLIARRPVGSKACTPQGLSMSARLPSRCAVIGLVLIGPGSETK
ncbi:protein of unknown function [Pararobbsia alpina]